VTINKNLAEERSLSLNRRAAEAAEIQREFGVRREAHSAEM